MPATFIWLIKGRYQLAVTAGYCPPAFFTEEVLWKKKFLGPFSANSGSQRRDTKSHLPLDTETQLVQKGPEPFWAELTHFHGVHCQTNAASLFCLLPPSPSILTSFPREWWSQSGTVGEMASHLLLAATSLARGKLLCEAPGTDWK